MIIETDELLFRSWQDSDAKELYEIAKSPLVGPPAGFDIHESVEHSLGFINKCWYTENDFAVVRKSDDVIIGGASIMIGKRSLLNLPEDEAELGYWLGESFWNKGYATKILRQLTDFSFSRLSCSKLWCGYYEGNEASRRVQEKCGYKYQFTIDDMFYDVKGYPSIIVEHFTAVSRFDRPV